MKYYLIHITEVGGVESISMTACADREEAIKRWHGEIAYDMAAENVTHSFCAVMNSAGVIEEQETHSKAVVTE